MGLGLHWLSWTFSGFLLHTRGSKETGLIGKVGRIGWACFCPNSALLFLDFSRSSLLLSAMSKGLPLPLHTLSLPNTEGHLASLSGLTHSARSLYKSPQRCFAFCLSLLSQLLRHSGLEEQCSLLSQLGSIKINSVIFISHLGKLSRLHNILNPLFHSKNFNYFKHLLLSPHLCAPFTYCLPSATSLLWHFRAC